MPYAKDMEREISLEDKQAVTGMIDPSREIDQTLIDGRPRWTFHLLVEGEPCQISGGKRLKNAFLIAGIRKWNAPRKVTVTALGAARSFDRTYTVEVSA